MSPFEAALAGRAHQQNHFYRRRRCWMFGCSFWSFAAFVAGPFSCSCYALRVATTERRLDGACEFVHKSNQSIYPERSLFTGARTHTKGHRTLFPREKGERKLLPEFPVFSKELRHECFAAMIIAIVACWVSGSCRFFSHSITFEATHFHFNTCRSAAAIDIRLPAKKKQTKRINELSERNETANIVCLGRASSVIRLIAEENNTDKKPVGKHHVIVGRFPMKARVKLISLVEKFRSSHSRWPPRSKVRSFRLEIVTRRTCR